MSTTTTTTTDNGTEINKTVYPSDNTTHIEIPGSSHFIAEHERVGSMNHLKLNHNGEGVTTTIRFTEVSRKGDHFETITDGFNFAVDGQKTASINDEELTEGMIDLLKSRYV